VFEKIFKKPAKRYFFYIKRLAIYGVILYTSTMNKKQRQTLKKIFEKPTRGDIKWSDIENLLRVLDAEISEGSGSRVRIALKGHKAVYHRPHPQKETVKGAVDSLRKDLIMLGIRP
jgi:hypothetical protein